MFPTLVSVSDLRYKTQQILAGLPQSPAIILRRNRPQAVLLEYGSFTALLRRLEDLDDVAAIKAALAEPGDSVPAEELWARLDADGLLPAGEGRVM